MWLSPLKGAYLTLGQIDKTLPVAPGTNNVNAGIKRGSIVYVDPTTNTFALYDSTAAGVGTNVPYIALQDYNDFQAGMAGNVGMAPATVGAEPAVTGALATGAGTWYGAPGYAGQGVNGPRITAISMLQAGEYQTSNIDLTDVNSYVVGAALSVGDGGTLVVATTGKNIVGYVTGAAKKRWVNDLGASENGARISGGIVTVIDFVTAWVPV